VRIFVLGRSHVGKTPFARRTSEALGIRHVGASAWVRERFPAGADAAQMTAFAIAELRRDPAVSVASLRGRLAADEHAVIEGMRNPYDFTCTFDPRTDHAVFLELADGQPPTAFERGLDVIAQYLAWLEEAGLLDEGRVHRYRFATYGEVGAATPDTLEHAIVDFIAHVPRVVVDPRPITGRVHVQVPPFAAHVRAEFLYNMDPAKVGELRRCTVFTVSSYTGSAVTFQILLEDGAVFSYVPPHALVQPPVAEPQLDLADLVYHDAKSVDIAVQAFDALRGPVLAYFKRRDRWLAGSYLFTIDWYTGNEMLHVVVLANGQYALLPSHKLKFGEHPPGFEPYKKIRNSWVTGS
jgi:hypothetical protein